jgi:hypothetical protein
MPGAVSTHCGIAALALRAHIRVARQDDPCHVRLRQPRRNEPCRERGSGGRSDAPDPIKGNRDADSPVCMEVLVSAADYRKITAYLTMGHNI